MICLSAGELDRWRSSIHRTRGYNIPATLDKETRARAYLGVIRSAKKREVVEMSGFREAFGLDPVQGTHGPREWTRVRSIPRFDHKANRVRGGEIRDEADGEIRMRASLSLSDFATPALEAGVTVSTPTAATMTAVVCRRRTALVPDGRFHLAESRTRQGREDLGRPEE
jgi:hypothetical protein